MKVGLVQRNAPLEIVTNLHSKRKTEQMILFDAGTRFYGADASSLLGRKPLLTPTHMSVMLGRDADHPSVSVLSARHAPLPPSYNATRNGVCLTIKEEAYTPEELIAMVLTHAKDITVGFGANSAVRDCVLTVPSFFTQHERRALLDAAVLADLNVLALIDENTAAALHFGMDRIDETPVTVMFYNMGASATQVSIVRYGSYERKESKFDKKGKLVGSFEVIGKGWDSTLGGLAFDDRLVDFMATEYQEQRAKKGVTKDVRGNIKAMTKLKIQANKAKHILSANSDTPIFMEALADDIAYQSHISRAKFEEISHDLLLEAVKPVDMALKSANLTMDDIDMIEMIGGGMRIPKIQEELTEMAGKELGMHINSDESMALGAAFHGANVSTAFRVRHIGMTDVNPFSINVGLEDMVIEEDDKKEDGEEEKEKWSKSATVFKEFTKVGVKKTIAFTHDREVNCKIDYLDSDYLPKGTELEIEKYNITGIAEFAKEMTEKGLSTPKVSLQFELSTSGITKLIKAEAAVDEIIQVEVDEEYEVDVEDEEEASSNETVADAEKPKEDETAAEEEKPNEEEKIAGEEKPDEEEKEEAKPAEEEAKETEKAEEENKEDNEKAETEGKKNETKKEAAAKKPKKKKMTKKVMKDKKKTHKRALTITAYHIAKVQPYSESLMKESKAKLKHLAKLDEERQKLEEIKNKVESYIYHIKNKLIDDEDKIAKVTTEEQRESVSNMAMEAEDWMYEDGYDADYTTYSEKYVELSTPFEAILFRLSELTARPTEIASLKTKLDKVRGLLTKWDTDKPQVTQEEKEAVLEQVTGVEKWIEDMQAKQAETPAHETPAFESKEVPLQLKDIEASMRKLSKKPKPKPPKKNETETKEGEGNETETKEGEGNDTETGKADDTDETASEEGEAANESESNDDEEKKETSEEPTEEKTEDKEAIEDEL